MAETKKFPSLPPNYVSLLDLKAIQDAKKQQQKQEEEEDRRKAREEQASLEEERKAREEQTRLEAEEERLKQEQDNQNIRETREAPDSNSHSTRTFRRWRVYAQRRFELSRANLDQIEAIGAGSDGNVGKVYNRWKIKDNRTNLDEAEKIGAESVVIAGNIYNRRKLEASRTNPVQVGDESDVIVGNVCNRWKHEANRTNPDEIEETRAECEVIVLDKIGTVEAGDDSTKKKNKKKGKPKTVKIMIGDVESVTDVVVNENIPARRKGKQIVCLPKKDCTVEILGGNFGDFSVNMRNVEDRESTKLGFEKYVDSDKLGKTKEQTGEKLGNFSVNRRKCEGRERTRLGFKGNVGGKKSVDSHKDLEAMLRIEEKTVEYEEKIECLPVSKMNEEDSKRNGGGGRNTASRSFCNGGGGRNVDSGRFYGGGSNRRDRNFVWVKKDKVSDEKQILQ